MSHAYNRQRIDPERLEFYCPDCGRTVLVSHSDLFAPMTPQEFLDGDVVFAGDVNVSHGVPASAEYIQGMLDLGVGGDVRT